jgi:hypothetical protein
MGKLFSKENSGKIMVDIKKNRSTKAGAIKNQPSKSANPATKPVNEDVSTLDKAIDSLSEQKKKLDIAMYYTHHDAEKSKNMIAGTYKDVFVIKVKFSVSTTYGAFIVFFNIPYCSLVHVYAIMSHSYIVDDLKTITPWRVFEQQMDELDRQGGHDSELTSKMRTDLMQTFTVQIGANQRASELKKYLESNDQITANRIIQKFIRDKFGFQNINPSVDYEQISSLDMELYSATSKKVVKELLSPENEKKKEEVDVEQIEESDEEAIDKKDIQLILQGNLILSPIKGKEIRTIEIGDRIRITLNNSSPKAVTVAKAFKAYEDGKILPITCRVVSIRHLIDGGYKIFCIIAKGIYVKIQEEEEGIKIDAEIQGESEESSHPYIPVIFVVAVVFLIIIAIALVLVLK